MTRDHHNCIVAFAVHAVNGEEATEIGKIVRLGGLSSTNLSNSWPYLHRNCLRGDRWAIEKDIPSEVLMRTPEFHDNPVSTQIRKHEASVRSLCQQARWFS